MLDEIAIQQTINAYTEASCRRDFEVVLSTFTEDGFWELPDAILRSKGDRCSGRSCRHSSSPTPISFRLTRPP